MHVFVDVETVKRAVVTKLGVCEWGVVSQGRIGRLAEAGRGGRARPVCVAATIACQVADAGARCLRRTGAPPPGSVSSCAVAPTGPHGTADRRTIPAPRGSVS